MTTDEYGDQQRPVITTHRLEAFSDGVMAVIITIMAFNLKPPQGINFAALRHEFPALLVYILSFTVIGIYWNNHHHLFRASPTPRISGAIMWANLHLLFWLSLVPVATAWVGTSYRHTLPAVTYGAIGLGAALSYSVLVRVIINVNGQSSAVSAALGSDVKGYGSLVLYATGIAFSFLSPWISYGLYASVSALWFIPDRRLVG